MTTKKRSKGPRRTSGRRSEERIVESRTGRGGAEPSELGSPAASDVDTRSQGLGMTDVEVDVDERDADLDEG